MWRIDDAAVRVTVLFCNDVSIQALWQQKKKIVIVLYIETIVHLVEFKEYYGLLYTKYK